MIKTYVSLILGLIFSCYVQGQQLQSIRLSSDSSAILEFGFSDGSTQKPAVTTPLVSFVQGNKLFFSNNNTSAKIRSTVSTPAQTKTGMSAVIQFFNTSSDTIRLTNVVPFGEGRDRVYITGKGDHELSR